MRKFKTSAMALCVLVLSSVSAVSLGAAELPVTEAQAKEAALVRPLPEYPAMARQLKITGKVELQVTISPEGKVEDVKILTGNPVLTKSCAKIVADWKFRPFLQEGKPSRAIAPLSFDFR